MIIDYMVFKHSKQTELQACAAAPERVTPRFQARIEGGGFSRSHQTWLPIFLGSSSAKVWSFWGISCISCIFFVIFVWVGNIMNPDPWLEIFGCLVNWGRYQHISGWCNYEPLWPIYSLGVTAVALKYIHIKLIQGFREIATPRFQHSCRQSAPATFSCIQI